MRLLDLFCGAGGAAVGYYRAGFDEIVGVDINPQPDYPFEFHQLDATLLFEYGGMGLMPDAFDLVHASPPCQIHSPISTGRWGKDSARWPDLIPPTRDFLLPYTEHTPYVIENVRGARKSLVDPIIELTGEMFGLTVHRPRLFELGGWDLAQPKKVKRQRNPVSVYGKPDGRLLWRRKDGTELRAWNSVEQGRAALGVLWVEDELQVRESIPPAYTQYIGERFLDG